MQYLFWPTVFLSFVPSAMVLAQSDEGLLGGDAVTLSAGAVSYSETQDDQSSIRVGVDLDASIDGGLYWTAGVNQVRVDVGRAANDVDPAFTLRGTTVQGGIGYELNTLPVVFGTVRGGAVFYRAREAGGTEARIANDRGAVISATGGIRGQQGPVRLGAAGEWAQYHLDGDPAREVTFTGRFGFEVSPGLVLSGIGQVVRPVDQTPSSIDTYVLGVAARFAL